MKIKIAFLWPHNNQGIWWGDRKFSIYYKYLNEQYFDKYFIYIVSDGKLESYDSDDKILLTQEHILEFLISKNIDFVYFAWAKITTEIRDNILNDFFWLVNVNFTDCYTTNKKLLNLIISKTDYWKIKFINGNLNNSYVVYNPIDFNNWIRLSTEIQENHRDIFKEKNYIIWRLARAEPSKWHYLIIGTLLKLQKEDNYWYWFIFAGMPYLYKKTLKLILNKKMYNSILFLPELKKLEDISKFYNSIDLFWQTSWIWESFGNVIAESFCFNVPVMTDFKDFYREWSINKKLYDAQIELVDNKINWGYCSYPEICVNFLKTHSLEELQHMGKNGYKKVEKIYNVEWTCDTLTKILYDFGRKQLHFQYDKIFEKIEQTPSMDEINKYKDVYIKRIKDCYKHNKIVWIDKILYLVYSSIRRSIEYCYLIYRKASKVIFHIDIEQ